MRSMLATLSTALTLVIVTLAPSQLRAAMPTTSFGFNGANGATDRAHQEFGRNRLPAQSPVPMVRSAARLPPSRQRPIR